jgi:RNA polymerase sigma-70 factor (ECF subfamily)
MNRREKRRVNREIAAIASLKDSEIDTSDIPEISDWTGAVTGKFYRPEPMSALQLKDTESKSEALVGNERSIKIDWQATTGAAEIVYEHLAPDQLLAECFKGAVEPWTEFTRRWHRLIESVVLRTARRWGQTSPDVIEDLVQDAYIKLFIDQCKVLKKFTSTNPDAFVGFLKVVTAHVVQDHFRKTHAQARGNTAELGITLSDLTINSAEENDLSIFLVEVNKILSTSVSERERAIFWLYYRHGCTSGQIAAIPTIKLTVKGVESVIFRLTQLLKQKLSSDVEKRLSGNR